MKTLAHARLKRAKALELAADGRSFDEIARAVGFAHRGSAHRAVFRALDERETRDADRLRVMENDRLDHMLQALWPAIQQGDVEAITAAIRISDLRMRLLGLMPARSTAERGSQFRSLIVGPVEGNPGEATLEEVEQWSRLARAARGTDCDGS